jgi:tape measure domain-containing protein
MAFASLVVKISGDISSLDQATRKAVERVKTLGSNLQSVGSSLALGVSAPLAGIAGAALKAAGDLEAMKLGLVSVAGGAKQAEVQFAQLREVAKLPGLGLKEAVQGSINLQALGFSAQKSQNLLLQFGNALATVGRGREDLNEVIRQLGQLGARGAVTADNLRPILERVPQVASIIKEKFGGDALGNPAETFKKLGISSQQFIAILEEELGKLPRVSGGFKNDLENLSDSVQIAFAKAGEALIPFAKAFIDDFAVPAISKIAELSSSFASLPSPIQSAGVGLAALVATAPLLITAAGTMITNFGVLTEALGRLGGAAAAATLAFKGFILVAGAVSAIKLYQEYAATAKAAEDFGASQKDLERSLSATVIKLREQGAVVSQSLVEDWNRGRISSQEFAKELRKIAIEVGAGKANMTSGAAAAAALGGGLDKAGAAAAKAAFSLEQTGKRIAANTTESQVLHRMLAILNQRHDEWIDRMAKARLGIGELLADLPQFGEQAVNVRKLGDEFGYVRQAAEEAALSIKAASIDLGKFDTSPSKQRESDMGRVAKENQKEYEEQLKAGAREAKKFERQVSLIANDLARNITDLIFKGGKLKDVLASTFSELGKSLVRSALETQLKRVVGLVTNLATSLPGVGKAIGAIFGVGGGAAQAAGGIAGAAGGVAGAAGSAAGSIGGVGGAAGSVASSGAMAIAGLATGIASAVSGIIGNFQFAAMNKTLDLIEKETRYSQIHLGYILEKINLHLPMLNSIHDRLATVVTQGIGVYNAPSDAGLRLQGSGGSGLTININNPTFGAGTTQAGITAMLTEAARQAALAGATA